MHNFDKYLSVRWQMGGRVYPVLDCYGLVHEVRSDLGLPEWPLFEGVIKEGGRMHGAFRSMLGRTVRCSPSPGAVAACYSGGMVAHVGIVIERDGVLQVMDISSSRGVSVVPVRRFERRHQKVEYYL